MVGGKEYEGIPGLWGLLTTVKPSFEYTTDNCRALACEFY